MEIIKKCPPPLSLRSRGSLNSLGTRTPLYPQVCSNSPAFAWVGLWWECRWEDGIHHLGWQMPVSIWQTDSPHLSLQHLHQTYQVAHWCLWIWPGSHPLPDPQWWNGCHNLLSQQTLNQSWDALPISQIAAPHPQVGCGWEIPEIYIWINLWHLHWNNPLIYVLTMAKLDCMNNPLVVSFAN